MCGVNRAGIGQEDVFGVDIALVIGPRSLGEDPRAFGEDPRVGVGMEI